jgi:TMEM175 potassium channel family protein
LNPSKTSYNQIAGESIERLAALSDGIFAVAMTLLVLDLRVPAQAVIHSQHDLAQALIDIAPEVLTYFMSFLTLGIFWVGQQTQLNFVGRGHRSLVWAHLGFLFGVTLTPFSTRLLGDFPAYRVAVVSYWANLLWLGVALYLTWTCTRRLALTKADMPPEVPRLIQRRIIVYQSLYAVGALLCLVGTYWSIAFIVVVQLTAAVTAPRR